MEERREGELCAPLPAALKRSDRVKRRYGDYPIDEMIEAATAAKNGFDAVFAALILLDQVGGLVLLPLEDGGGWRPDLKDLRRRTLRRWRVTARRGRPGLSVE
jgi:hypothetical protein